jgi:glycosyltransferase involved in cell wall biosynthesis
MEGKIKILVNTSTFKTKKIDPIPEFINKLLDELKMQNSKLQIKVLKPMNGIEKGVLKLENYDVYSYRYFFPLRLQNLSEKGIKPSLELNKFNVFKLLLLCISQFFSLLKLTIIYKPDFIYCHWFIPQVIITYLVSKITKTKYIFTSHGSDVLLINNLGKIGSFIVRVVTRSAYKYTAVSSLVLNEINKNLNEDKNNYQVIPMGLDNRFYKINFKKNIKNKKIKFLYIGRLVDYKGVDILLNSLSLYKKINNNFELSILGTGANESELKKLSSSLSLNEHVNFFGFKSFSEKIKYIEECDLMVVPSKIKKGQIEGGPLTLIEGMSVGKICIVSDSIGFIDYCNENNSIIFKSENTKSLLQAILKYENLSTEKKYSLSKNAAEVSKVFSFEEIGKRHYKFFFEKQ